MSDRGNYYACLGVSKDATAEEIRAAYFELARRFHPDTNPEPNAAEIFLTIQEAYDVLSNQQLRLDYDLTLPADAFYKPEIELTINYSRSRVARMQEPQLIYVHMELATKETAQSTKQAPLNLCLVLDRSTSMQGARMEMVKANAIQLLRQLEGRDIISIVAFSDRAEVLIPPTRVVDLPRLEARIAMLLTGGSTEIYQGLETGLSQLRYNLNPSFINHLILLTDGRTYGDEEACLELAEKAANDGIGISGIGIGHEWNDAFLDKLTSISGGSSMYVSAPKDLLKHLQHKFHNLDQVYAEGVYFHYKTTDSIELRYAYRMEPESDPLILKNPLRFGNLVKGKPLKVLLEYYIKDVEKADEIILSDGNIHMEIPAIQIPHVKIPLRLVRPVGDAGSYEIPPHMIIQAMSKLTVYRMQEKALQEVKAGEIRAATRHLQQLATHLLSQGERELAHTVLTEAEHVQRNQRFTKEGDKRIKYGTRALLLPPGAEYKKP